MRAQDLLSGPPLSEGYSALFILTFYSQVFLSLFMIWALLLAPKTCIQIPLHKVPACLDT